MLPRHILMTWRLYQLCIILLLMQGWLAKYQTRHPVNFDMAHNNPALCANPRLTCIVVSLCSCLASWPQASILRL